MWGHVSFLVFLFRTAAAAEPLTCASLLQGEDFQVKTVEHSEVLLPEEHHAPLHTLYLLRQAPLITHGGV